MKFNEIFTEGYNEVTQKFSQEAAPNEVKKVIDMYRELVNKNQVKGDERNIDWWGKQGWENFDKFVTAKSQQKTQSQQKKSSATGKSHTLDETTEWLIVVPLDKDASCFHGKGSDWCTTKPHQGHFESYFLDTKITLIYFLRKSDGAKWAIASYTNAALYLDDDDGIDDYNDFFDINDNQINLRTFQQQTGIDPEKYIGQVQKNTTVGAAADASRATMQAAMDKLKALLDTFDGKSRSHEIETLLLSTSHPASIKDYMLMLTNSSASNAPLEFDQNMQTLIVSNMPDKAIMINASTKTLRMLFKQYPEVIVNWMARQGRRMVKFFEENPDIIPDPTQSPNIGRISITFQRMFIEHNPLWLIYFDTDLAPEFQEDITPGITQWFADNPNTHAIVVEAGLTDLIFMQLLTKDEYAQAAANYGEDLFEVITRDNLN
jgi:hypothetical protein